MKLTFTEDTNLEQKRRECLDYLNRTKVDVGLTSSASGRSRFLMALHEHGAPGAHIPARPVIAPALGTEEAREAVSRELLNAVSAANRGSREETEAALEKAGEAGADAIRAYIDAGVPPPNAPLTVSGGWIRNFSSKKPVHVAGKGFNKPLYDTGELYNDFDYEITER
jgi:hypothetical protein